MIRAAAFAATILSTPLSAQDASNPDPVFLFNSVCYSRVPNVTAIQDMAANLGWRQMPPEDQAQFQSTETASFLDGWDALVGERLFRVGLVQFAPPPSMAAAFPDFSTGTATSCSIILDDQQDAARFMPNMQTLIGKAPVSSEVPEGELLTTTWAGGNEQLKVFVFAKHPSNLQGGLLNVTVLQR